MIACFKTEKDFSARYAELDMYKNFSEIFKHQDPLRPKIF